MSRVKKISIHEFLHKFDNAYLYESITFMNENVEIDHSAGKAIIKNVNVLSKIMMVFPDINNVDLLTKFLQKSIIIDKPEILLDPACCTWFGNNCGLMQLEILSRLFEIRNIERLAQFSRIKKDDFWLDVYRTSRWAIEEIPVEFLIKYFGLTNKPYEYNVRYIKIRIGSSGRKHFWYKEDELKRRIDILQKRVRDGFMRRKHAILWALEDIPTEVIRWEIFSYLY